MKIALVSPYDFAYPGGVTNHISALERQFTKMGHEVKVIAPASKIIPDFGDRFIPIGRPRSIPVSGSIIRITVSLRLASRIKEVLSREKFNIIHLHEPFMPMLCSAVLRFSETTNVGTFHACDGNPGYRWGKPISTIMIKRRAHKLHGRIAVSKSAMEFARKFLPKYYNYEAIPNGVDVNHFSPIVAPIDKFCDGKLNILFVGRLEKRKGLNYLLKAYNLVRQEISNCRLIVVGPGTRLRKRYERLAKRANIPDVTFVGTVSYDELPRYYKTADIYCSPATGGESFGLVLLEAMALGKPVVATSIEGYANVVTHGVEGLLVPPKDIEELTRALVFLLRDETRRRQMGEKGELKAQNYRWELVAQRVLSYYRKILSRSP